MTKKPATAKYYFDTAAWNVKALFANDHHRGFIGQLCLPLMIMMGATIGTSPSSVDETPTPDIHLNTSAISPSYQEALNTTIIPPLNIAQTNLRAAEKDIYISKFNNGTPTLDQTQALERAAFDYKQATEKAFETVAPDPNMPEGALKDFITTHLSSNVTYANLDAKKRDECLAEHPQTSLKSCMITTTKNPSATSAEEHKIVNGIFGGIAGFMLSILLFGALELAPSTGARPRRENYRKPSGN